MATTTHEGHYVLYAGHDFTRIGEVTSFTFTWSSPDEIRMQRRWMPYREWKRRVRGGK